jgi:hypothetical protein
MVKLASSADLVDLMIVYLIELNELFEGELIVDNQHVKR